MRQQGLAIEKSLDRQAVLPKAADLHTESADGEWRNPGHLPVPKAKQYDLAL